MFKMFKFKNEKQQSNNIPDELIDNSLIHYSKVIINDISKYNQNDPKDLFDIHKKRVFCQNGEDGIIEYIFKVVSPMNKYYVEFGGWDGVHLSNTANLRINNGWNGLLLEGNKDKVLSMKNRKEINLHNEFVTSDNINSLFQKYNVPKDFDLLSIDIDSNDYYIWKALTEFRPTLVVVETNPGINNKLPLSVIENKANIFNKNGSTGNYFGANLHAFYKLANKKGYKLLTVNRWNAFFITNEKFKLFDINSITKDEMLTKYCISEKYWVKRNKYIEPPYYWKIVD